MNRIAVAALLSSLVALPALAQQASPYPDPAAQTGATPTGAPMRGPGRGGGGGGGGGAGMMRMADANGDGIVTRAEYTAAVDARFDRMDRNHDGVLSPDEMPARGEWRGGRGGQGGADAPPPPPPNALSPQATGTPPAPAYTAGRPPETRDQYRAAAMRRFDRMDTNHDGRIDQAEMAAPPPGRPMRGGMGDAPPPAGQ
ncbi:hypothetical protein [uncultured Sphingomonas sp.]|uniref:hypothetical protein n=1 Tax=uncultured Sphingomonas sp. TaxID=158754 RepID=UPI0035CBF183